MMARQTVRKWMEELNDDTRKLSREEFDSMMLYHIREYTQALRNQADATRTAIEHIELILTRMEGVLADRIPNYPHVTSEQALAERGR
jgi:glucosamine 6-phosphate synthetase-like amidotransferase/phosphosugar isomerase protein